MQSRRSVTSSLWPAATCWAPSPSTARRADAAAICTRAERAGDAGRERRQAVHHLGKHADLAIVFAITDRPPANRHFHRADRGTRLHRLPHRSRDGSARFGHGANHAGGLRRSRPTICSAPKARATASHWQTSNQGASTSPRNPWAWRNRRGACLRRRAHEFRQTARRASGGEFSPGRHGHRHRSMVRICTRPRCATAGCPA